MRNGTCFTSRLCALLLSSLMVFLGASACAHAQAITPMTLDTSFGFGGYAGIPTVDPGASGAVPLGFVHLPLSGGYLVLSQQYVSGTSRIVATRFTDGGWVDTAWGNAGSLFYALPVPTDATSFGSAKARMLLALEGSPAVEVIYLLGLYPDNDNRPNLMAARLGANGALLSVGNNALFGLFGGAGTIDAAAPAASGTLLTGHPGVLVAVRGQDQAVNTTILVQVFTPSGTANTQIVDYGTNDVRLTRPNLRINQLVPRNDGSFEAVGTEAGMALYLHYDAHALSIVAENYFALSCGNGGGMSSASVADGLLRNGTTTWVLGRTMCAGMEKRAVLARIANIDFAPAHAWSTHVSEPLAGQADFLEPCLACSVAMAEGAPGQVQATSPSGYLARVDAQNGQVRSRNALSISQPSATLAVMPTHRFGQWQSPPGLTGLAIYHVPPDPPLFGLGRIVTDALIFADGMESPAPARPRGQ